MEWGMPSLLECEGVAQDRELGARCGLDFVEVNLDLRSAAELSPTDLASRCGRFCTLRLCEGTAPSVRRQPKAYGSKAPCAPSGLPRRRRW